MTNPRTTTDRELMMSITSLTPPDGSAMVAVGLATRVSLSMLLILTFSLHVPVTLTVLGPVGVSFNSAPRMVSPESHLTFTTDAGASLVSNNDEKHSIVKKAILDLSCILLPPVSFIFTGGDSGKPQLQF